MKKFFALTLLLAVAFFSASCQKEAILYYEAYVTIVNWGNVPMDGAVEDQWVRIQAASSATWAVPLDSENEVVDVLVEAQPAIGEGYDTTVIRLIGDRDVQTWITGWDSVTSSANLLKIQSRVLAGKQDHR